MDNLIQLFPPNKPAPAKDVSTETYFFTFAGTNVHFGGGAFTRDLLERLDAHRDTVKQLITRETGLKLDAIATVATDLDAEMKAMISDVIRLEADCILDMIDRLHTPNDLDAFLSDNDTVALMPLLLAATIHAAYVPFDLLRMQRANWCLIENDVNAFYASLVQFFTETDRQFALIRQPKGDDTK